MAHRRRRQIAEPGSGRRLVDLYARLMSAVMALAPRLIRAGSRGHARVARTTKGRVGGTYIGAPVLVLAVRGRRSGRRREIPLYFVRQAGNFVVTAANLGATSAPAWYVNLMAAGHARVFVGGAATAVTPRVTSGNERERLWAELRRIYRGYDVYQRRTNRAFAVIVLTPEPD